MGDALTFLARHDSPAMRNLAAGMYVQGAAATWIRQQLAEKSSAPEIAFCEIVVGRRRVVLDPAAEPGEIVAEEWRGPVVIRSHSEPCELLAYYAEHMPALEKKLRTILPFVTAVDLSDSGLWTISLSIWI